MGEISWTIYWTLFWSSIENNSNCQNNPEIFLVDSSKGKSRCVIPFHRIWHFIVFISIALFVGLTIKRARNYISLIGIVTLILLGTIGKGFHLQSDG